MDRDIVDFECDLHSANSLEKLFLKACRYLKARGAKSIVTWALPHTLLYQVVKSIGFVDELQERYFCIQVINPKCSYLYDFDQWNLIMADVEFY